MRIPAHGYANTHAHVNAYIHVRLHMHAQEYALTNPCACTHPQRHMIGRPWAIEFFLFGRGRIQELEERERQLQSEKVEFDNRRGRAGRAGPAGPAGPAGCPLGALDSVAMRSSPGWDFQGKRCWMRWRTGTTGTGTVSGGLGQKRMERRWKKYKNVSHSFPSEREPETYV